MGKEKFFLILILILGSGLRLIKLDQSFWLDEASQAQLSSMSLSQIWSNRPGDFHPPLFYFLAHYWLQLGRSETWLRLLPISFGILNIAVIYYLAYAINPKLGLTAAFLLAINPFHVYYSQEFRMYSLLALLGTLSMSAFYKNIGPFSHQHYHALYPLCCGISHFLPTGIFAYFRQKIT